MHLAYNNSRINRCDGVVVYVRNNLKHNAIIESHGQTKFLSVILEFENDNNFKITSIYRCFGIDKLTFIQNLKQLLLENLHLKNHYIVGDFNIDLLNIDSVGDTFLNNFLEHEYLPNF